METKIFEVFFEVTHRRSTVANTYIQYEEGTSEDQIIADYENFVSDVESNLDSSWEYVKK